jgi:hypothetical protein
VGVGSFSAIATQTPRAVVHRRVRRVLLMAFSMIAGERLQRDLAQRFGWRVSSEKATDYAAITRRPRSRWRVYKDAARIINDLQSTQAGGGVAVVSDEFCCPALWHF